MIEKGSWSCAHRYIIQVFPILYGIIIHTSIELYFYRYIYLFELFQLQVILGSKSSIFVFDSAITGSAICHISTISKVTEYMQKLLQTLTEIDYALQSIIIPHFFFSFSRCSSINIYLSTYMLPLVLDALLVYMSLSRKVNRTVLFICIRLLFHYFIYTCISHMQHLFRSAFNFIK